MLNGSLIWTMGHSCKAPVALNLELIRAEEHRDRWAQCSCGTSNPNERGTGKGGEAEKSARKGALELVGSHGDMPAENLCRLDLWL